MQRHLVMNGDMVLAEDPAPEQVDQWLRDFYAEIGGHEFFLRLATAFYRLVAADDLLAPLFAGGSWERHATRLAGHFDRMYGKPDRTEAWAPRLLTAHTRFLISHEHRARWLDALREAGRQISSPEPLFSDFVATMVMATGDLMGVSRGAAISRGESFDRFGVRRP